MCRVVARASARAMAEGETVNVIAMPDVSACHWDSAGSFMPGRNPRAMAGNPVPGRNPMCLGGKARAMAGKLVSKRKPVPWRETLCHGEKARVQAGKPVPRRKPVPWLESSCKKISTQKAEISRKGRESQSRRM